MTRTPVVLALVLAVVLAFVILIPLAAGAAAVTVGAAGEEAAPTTSVPPPSAPDAETGDPPDSRHATPDESLPGTGGRASVLIGGALLVAAVVHWRLTAPPPQKD